jgi:CheY-specific phosphatase CheX
MNAIEIVLDHEMASVLKVVEQRTIGFLRDEIGLVADKISRHLHHNDHIVLRAMTAIVGVGSRDGLYIAYSYDESLIRAIATKYTAELSIAPGDEDLYMRETASDVVNIIVGNCTADLAQRGDLVILTSPVLMLGARTIQTRVETAIAVLTIQFPQGALDIAFVGPRRLFDDNLNYRGGIS